MLRRDMLKTLGSLPLLSLAPSLAHAELLGQPWNRARDALIFDAMGELRDVYTDDLIQEMLDAGMRAIAITLCDPKVQGQAAYDHTIQGILAYNRLLASKPQYYMPAREVADIDLARSKNKMAVFYLTQNSTHFMRDLDNVDVFYQLGLRASQITYNSQNWAGSGCQEPNGSGLTRFGHALIEKMNSVGMIVDLSHSNDSTIADSIAASKIPVHISHACCLELFKHERNISDRNLKALAEQGGLFGVTQMRPFMTEKVDNALEVYFDHILHAINVCGVDHVCIGSDRDHRRLVQSKAYLEELNKEEGSAMKVGDGPLYFEELNGPRRMETIWDGLKRRGLSEDALEKVMGLNLYNYYRLVVG